MILMPVILLAGCWPGYTSPVPQPPRTPEERRYHEIWSAATGILKDYGFTPEFQDRREGILITYAVTSGHLLEEIFRKDHSSIKDVTENTLHSIYRAVRVRFIRSGGDSFDITVEIAKARSNMPEAHVTDTSEVYSLSTRTMQAPPRLTFSDLVANPKIGKKTLLPKPLRGYSARIKDDEHPIFVPIGRDTSLEKRIAREIRTAAGLPQSDLEYVDPPSADGTESSQDK